MKRKKILAGILVIFAIIIFLMIMQAREYSWGAPGSKNYHLSLIHDNLTRNYWVHVPPAYDNEVPVVIYLHGGGGSPRSSYLDGMYPYSDKLGFILVSPAGTGPIPDRLLVWNAGQCCKYAIDRSIDDVGFISQMIDELEGKFNIDKKSIYATGISNGALMAYRLACELPDKIAAVSAVAPKAIPQNCSPSRPISIMQIHGTADTCNPYEGGIGNCPVQARPYFVPRPAKESVGFWKEMNNCPDRPETMYNKGNASCLEYGPCKAGTNVEFCTVKGMGHTWPSGIQYLPESAVGPVSFDISFDQMWDFFKKNPMRS